MKTTHYIQVSLACVAAAAGAALPFVPDAWKPICGALIAVPLAVAKVLGVQSEVKGDKVPS